MREVKGQRVFYLMLTGVLILGVLAAVRFVPRFLNREDSQEHRKSATVGSAAPDFTLRTSEGANVSLSDFRNKQAVLLYFSMGPG